MAYFMEHKLNENETKKTACINKLSILSGVHKVRFNCVATLKAARQNDILTQSNCLMQQLFQKATALNYLALT